MTTQTFQDFALCDPIQRALVEKKYETPSPVQAGTIGHVLAGRDVLGCAQTGTGKTAAFALPILECLNKKPANRRPNAPRVLVLAPTRELASQIKDGFESYGQYLRFKSLVIFGGVGQHPQMRALQQGPEILVATPGRLLDLHSQGHVDFRNLEIFVLDEADRMLDMGFIHDVKKIVALIPTQRQTLFFSATMPVSIQALADSLLKNPVRVEITPAATTVDKIAQRVAHVYNSQKRELLQHILRETSGGLALVFSRTKHGANRIAEGLDKSGIPALAIHGNKSQTARERALESFRSGKIRVLVATDIAARGIDVKGVELVVNFDLPNEPESYVHRIGRTARAGAEGTAIAFCGEDERTFLRDIEKTIRMKIPVWEDQPFVLTDEQFREAERAGLTAPPKMGGGGGPRRGGSGPRQFGGGDSRQNGPGKGGFAGASSRPSRSSSAPPRFGQRGSSGR